MRMHLSPKMADEDKRSSRMRQNRSYRGSQEDLENSVLDNDRCYAT